ncbi:DnaB-like helicase N-terminal domain-containing protein [Borreliella garinii]|uniref:DnaB-like helicase N-terminal domain-containing protein n=1 Tax=Borreliella garinii TaxID=29519 RepID=UPI00041E5838|nr:DnaB-like helicase N-terminal domain-containing protein [Borreliella garinii]
MKNNFGINDIIRKYSLFNRNSESVVIGSMLNNTVKIEEVLPYLKPNDFDFDVNKKIFLIWLIYMQKEYLLTLL